MAWRLMHSKCRILLLSFVNQLLCCTHTVATCLSLYSIAVYKALYKSFGGFAADVVAAIDQVNDART